jgi:uncharacterized protein (DUF2384 family)
MAAQTSPRERPLHQRDVGPAALRTFFRIGEAWELTAEEQMRLLGMTAPATYYKWRKQPPARLSPDMLERISYVLGIYKALQILVPDERLADAWVSRPNANPLFAGRPPKERMLSGLVADLYLVRSYLDGERGG